MPKDTFSVGDGAADDLTGRVALVTGASSGLGAHFATTLARAGAAIAIGARRADRLDDVRRQIEAFGGTCVSIDMDVTQFEQHEDVLDKIEARWGTVDILLNNAGIPDAQYATKLSPADIQRVIATNLTAPYSLSCSVARRLIKAGQRGSIVNLSSMGAFHYQADSAAALYSTTKAAVNRMTEVLAVEWARFGINVNAIAPGSFHSEMTDGIIARVGDPSRTFPRGRIGETRELDSTLMYLLSPRSTFVTGTILKVDDGQFPR